MRVVHYSMVLIGALMLAGCGKAEQSTADPEKTGRADPDAGVVAANPDAGESKDTGKEECTGQPTDKEICDGIDNNCNGEIDEGLNQAAGPASAGTAPNADLTMGVCDGAIKRCAGKDGWVEPDYMTLSDYEPVEYACDGVDNDCDGSIDEHCSFRSYGTVFGDGSEANSDNGQWFMNTTLGAPRFVGTAKNSKFSVKHSLPQGEKK